MLTYWDTSDPRLVPSEIVEGNYNYYKQQSMIRFSNTTYGYEDLTESARETVWWTSGADALLFPLFESSDQFYQSFYTGYDNGLSYFSPGFYSQNIFAPTIPSNSYDFCDDLVPDHFTGYDCRCRPWYIN